MATTDAQKADDIPQIQNLSVQNTTDDHSSTPSDSTPAASGYDTPLTDVGNAAHTSPDKEEHNEKSDGPRKTPFAHPLPSAKPIARPPLTPEQGTKYTTLLATVREWKSIPTTSARNSPTEPLSETEQMWLSRECLLRYLRATNWVVTKAADRLAQTITWRREYGVEKQTPEYVGPENETGKQVILGYDNDARPCLYLNPAKQNTKQSPRQLEHLVFMLDRVIEMMDPGQESTALLINFKNSSAGGNPSVSQGKQTLNILQGHYPERLGRALISDLPWYVTTFFKLISPFIDPVTKEKMIFNQDLRKYVPPAQLDKAYNGDVPFEYDHSVYWPELNRMCTERREKYRERWVNAGKRIGEYEAYMRGGDQKPLRDVEQEE